MPPFWERVAPPATVPRRHSRSARCMRSSAVMLCLWAAAVLPEPQKAVAQPDAAAFAGSEACATCHEDISNTFAKNPHKRVDAGSGPRFKGLKEHACEACHGAAQKHTESVSAEDIRNPSKLVAAEVDKLCLTCHLNQPTHVGRLQSSHAKDQVACTTCHKIHANGPLGLVARKASAVNEQCAGCHTSVWSQFQKPFHHRVAEGAMSCVDCHNPHGSVRPAMTQIFG